MNSQSVGVAAGLAKEREVACESNVLEFQKHLNRTAQNTYRLIPGYNTFCSSAIGCN